MKYRSKGRPHPFLEWLGKPCTGPFYKIRGLPQLVFRAFHSYWYYSNIYSIFRFLLILKLYESWSHSFLWNIPFLFNRNMVELSPLVTLALNSMYRSSMIHLHLSGLSNTIRANTRCWGTWGDITQFWNKEKYRVWSQTHLHLNFPPPFTVLGP